MTAFCVFGEDNDSYAFRIDPVLTEHKRTHQELLPNMSGHTRPSVRRCKACGELLDKWNDPLDGLVLKKREHDVSSTYDGVVVVSTRFKMVYETALLSGLSFHTLPDDPVFFAISADRVVEFDAERRKTRFIKPCNMCNQLESIVGATPVYLKNVVAIGSREFVRTDLEFGSNDEKRPLLLCGEGAADTLQNAKLKGLDLDAIEAKSMGAQHFIDKTRPAAVEP